MAINDNREEKAQLDRREFDLDIEEQERQRKERDAMIVKVRIFLFPSQLKSIFICKDAR
jgi:hypothetical protein